MKRYIIILLSLFVFSCSAFSQLTIENSCDKDLIVAECRFCSIIKVGNTYELNVFDKSTSTPIVINLGVGHVSARMSLMDLQKWFENAEQSEYATIKNADGRDITIYKGNRLIVSTGSGDFVRSELKQMSNDLRVGILFGAEGLYVSKADDNVVMEDKPLMGYVPMKFLKKTIEAL